MFANKFYDFYSFVFSLRGRESRAVKQQSKDVVDDDTNDFNDDYSLIEAFARAEAEGNLTKARAKTKSGLKQIAGTGATGVGFDDDDNGYGGYGYGGYRGKLIFTSITCHCRLHRHLKQLQVHSWVLNLFSENSFPDEMFSQALTESVTSQSVIKSVCEAFISVPTPSLV